MDTRRALLTALADGPISGPALADTLGVSRAAVWKAVESLRDEGFAVKSTPDGYVPPDDPGYCAAGIEFGLDAPYQLEYYDQLASTNDRARTVAADNTVRANTGPDTEAIAVIADEQTGGRGRLGREWIAPSGGVWVSVAMWPDIPPARAPLCTLASAVAVVDACQRIGVETHIKWPNDVLVGDPDSAERGGPRARRGGRKLTGILTEMEGEADRVSWLVVGIGVNANIDREQLPDGATSLRAELGHDIDRRAFVVSLLERFSALTATPDSIDNVLPAWREHASTLGRRVRVETTTGSVTGTAVAVESPGALVVETDAGTQRVHAGDCEHLHDAGR